MEDGGSEADSEDSDDDVDHCTRFGFEHSDDEEGQENEPEGNTGSDASANGNNGKCNFLWICNFFQY